ncbi:MAG: SH3 domain-containing protein [Patescibacteria group bacterium]
MQSAQRCLIILTIILAAFIYPSGVKAAVGSAQKCTTATDCTIGEFFYDDSYIPITDATCNLTSKYPDGTSHLTSQAMSAAADGWYSHTFTAPATTGLYRAQVCCTSGTDYLCLDKSFEVVVAVSSANSLTTDQIASAVWGYSGRSLTTFGSLSSDIWNNSTRTLSSFGSLVADIWNSSSSTITGIETKTTETRNLVEKLVNRPIIENILEEEEIDLESKVNQTQGVTERIFVNGQYVNSTTQKLTNSWKKLTKEQLVDELLTIEETVKGTSGQDSLTSLASWIKSTWDWKQADDVADQITAISASTKNALTLISTEGKTPQAKEEIIALAKYALDLEKLVGNQNDNLASKTLYGKLKQTAYLSDELVQKSEEVDTLLIAFNADKKINANWTSQANDLERQIAAINLLPRGGQVLALDSFKKYNLTAEKQFKNRLLAMRGVLYSNKKLLALGEKSYIANTWLEEGSVVFKTLVTNPSALIEQKAAVKYYLPKELVQEDILEVDDGLAVKYDAEKAQLYVEGEIALSAGQTKTFSIRTQDIWEVTSAQIDSARKQTQELAKPLEKTAYFAQGVTLKSDIDVSLDKIAAVQATAITPEQKIRAYREAKIEMNSVQEKLTKMQDLVTQAGSINNFFGFVGGSQAIAVWGTIVIMIAGFVFLSVYMKSIIINGNGVSESTAIELPKVNLKNLRVKRLLKTILPMIIFGSLTALASGLVAHQVTVQALESKETITIQQDKQTQTLGTTTQNQNTKEKTVVIGETPTGWLRVRQTPNGEIVAKVNPGEEYRMLGEDDGWIQIQLSDGAGWVSAEFVKD